MAIVVNFDSSDYILCIQKQTQKRSNKFSKIIIGYVGVTLTRFYVWKI